jgi:putative effector of murein hydrolase
MPARRVIFPFLKVLLISTCFVMFFLLMTDVWDKYMDSFTSTAIGIKSRWAFFHGK